MAESEHSGEERGYVPTYRRDRSTKRSVLIADAVANHGITIGGLLVILAVVGILVFLVVKAAPLFGGGKVEGHSSLALSPVPDLAWINTDDYQTVGLRISDTGRIDSFHLATGTALASQDLPFEGRRATSVGATNSRDDLVFGFSDGTIRFARVALTVRVITAEMLPTGLRPLNETDSTDGAAVYRAITGNQFRRIAVEATLDAPQTISEAGAAIASVDYRVGGTVERPSRAFATIDATGTVRLSQAETRRNLMTGKETVTIQSATLPALPPGAEVFQVLLTGQADQVYVGDARGLVHRYDTRDFTAPALVESVRVTPEGARLTMLGFLNGDQTLVVGGADGSVRNFFRLQLPGATGTDGYGLVLARELEAQPAAIHGFGASQRRKSFVTADADGNIWYRHATSETVLFKLRGEPGAVDSHVMLAPRDDGVLTLGAAGKGDLWSVYAPHPETTLQAIFGKLWYEGYSEPTHTWQSSSGTDVFEPKFSLIPLIFGTLKATFYSLVFAIPISLMAAIYTSEFLHRRVRAAVKPVMEMMESLPTVVLGFVAALILAPLVETWIAAVLLAFVALPMSLMVAAYGWQMLPRHLVLRLEGLPKFVLFFVVVLLGCYIAYAAGPAFEAAFFAGDLIAWTNGTGSGGPFLFLILLPLAFCVVSYGFARTPLAGALREHLRGVDSSRAGMLDAARWAAMLAAAALLSAGAALLLTAAGYDPRGGMVDSYVQRNALVVGFVMGFAVIPNIYTLAEDALNAVPSHLRAASLAAGATPWQTAIWIIVPTAASGVFAAVMIGMGRAVGETMIVVMAAGNTPVLDWNIFNGLRTLSANIAVELPEAVVNGSLYRMLFFAALTLFVMTFCINTVAEVIRQRFRKRAFQL